MEIKQIPTIMSIAKANNPTSSSATLQKAILQAKTRGWLNGFYYCG
jgi:hypothetical protein